MPSLKISYTFEPAVAGDWTKGFKLKFLEGIKESIYTITYKTGFDPLNVEGDDCESYSQINNQRGEAKGWSA